MSKTKYDWAAVVQDQLASGLTIKQYCLSDNINVSSFYKHKNIVVKSSSNSLFLPITIFQEDKEKHIPIKINQAHLVVPQSLLTS